jgi:hypothetical protein
VLIRKNKQEEQKNEGRIIIRPTGYYNITHKITDPSKYLRNRKAAEERMQGIKGKMVVIGLYSCVRGKKTGWLLAWLHNGWRLYCAFS